MKPRDDDKRSGWWLWLRTDGALAIRLALAIIVLSVAASIVITAVQLVLQYRTEMRSIETRFAELRQLQVPVLRDAVWVYDEGQIRVQLAAITSLPDIETARILVDDRVAWSNGTLASTRTLAERFPLTRDDGRMLIGTLEVTVSLDKVHRRLVATALSILLQNAIQTLIVAAFALVIFQRWVTRHLYRMADYTRHLDIGRTDAEDLRLDRPAARQPDILDQVVNALNSMRSNLTGAYRELAAHNAELDESKKKFAALFHSSPVALSVSRCHEGAVIEDVNEAWVALFRKPYEAVLGREPGDPVFWKDASNWQDILAAVMQDGEIRRHEAWRRRGDGELMLCEISGRIFDVGSERLLLLAEEDITEKRRNEERIQELNATLEKRVEERTAELQAANAELSSTLARLTRTQDELLRAEKLAALGSLVAGVAHELNTPIGNAVMVASTLGQETRQLNEAYQSGSVKRAMLENFLGHTADASDILQRNLDRASELITSFKSIAVDQTSSQRRKFALKDVIHEVVVTLTPGLKKTPYKIVSDIPDEIRMDSFPGPLEQVVSNMINNSVFHGFDGAPSGTVRVSAAMAGDEEIELRVSDDGKGIPAEYQSRVFDPFFTTRLGQGGSGLGLNIAHTILTGPLGGHIRLESEPGKGTTFIMNLPLVAPEKPPANSLAKPAGQA